MQFTYVIINVLFGKPYFHLSPNNYVYAIIIHRYWLLNLVITESQGYHECFIFSITGNKETYFHTTQYKYVKENQHPYHDVQTGI